MFSMDKEQQPLLYYAPCIENLIMFGEKDHLLSTIVFSKKKIKL